MVCSHPRGLILRMRNQGQAFERLYFMELRILVDKIASNPWLEADIRSRMKEWKDDV